jgi:hypothetical protein
VYLTADPADAAVLLDKAIIACRADDVPEIAFRSGVLSQE